MTPEAMGMSPLISKVDKPDTGMQKTIRDLMLAAILAEVMKDPAVADALRETAKKFVPSMLEGMKKISEGAPK